MVISENRCTFIVLNYKVVQTIIAMFTEDKVTEIFFMADEFHKVFCRLLDKYSLNAPKNTGKRTYHRAGRLSVPEIMTIMILFHNSGYRCLKHFYLNEVCVNLRHLFPQVVSYNRFVELEKEAVIPLTIFIKKVLFHRDDIRQTCGRQGVYQQEPLPEALRGRHSAHHKTKEQYERCSDERFGQSAAA